MREYDHLEDTNRDGSDVHAVRSSGVEGERRQGLAVEQGRVDHDYGARGVDLEVTRQRAGEAVGDLAKLALVGVVRVDHRHRRAPGRVLLHLDLVTLLS